jgi:integrase
MPGEGRDLTPRPTSKPRPVRLIVNEAVWRGEMPAPTTPPGPLEAGADVVELQTLLGHASLDTTRRYLDATAEGLREVVRGHPGQVALRDHLRGSKS